jgi:hypothetical protein
MDMRDGGLLHWQWSLYAVGHHDRRNLLVHAATNPLFLAGTCVLVASPLAGLGFAVAGAALMLVAMAAQGRGHKLEKTAPVPFRGPGDLLVRFFAEQWVTFPRFVVTGGFAAAWRAAGIQLPRRE